ncbi:Sec7 guanine nucleotide exchange factor [Ceratobasidium sp. AG-Ba]|nr:Sec7 guanine nucleotide exchange factor [Ceratobasidium sp. AG-Ba]
MKAFARACGSTCLLKADPPSRDEMQVGPTTPISTSPPTEQLPYDPTSVFLLEMMVSIAVQTPQHIDEIWPIVFEHLSIILSSSARYSVLLVERAVVGIAALMPRCFRASPASATKYIFRLILGGLPPAVFSAAAEQIVAGLALLVQEHSAIVSSQTEWALVFSLIRNSLASTPGRVTPDNVTGLITSLEDFAATAGNSVVAKRRGQPRPSATPSLDASVERGVQAITTLADLKKTIPDIGLSPDGCAFCRNIRPRGFALIEEMLKPQLASRDPDGIVETRLRASALLCRSFLHIQAHKELLGPETKTLWLKIIDLLHELMQSGGRDQLAEAIPESLKNVVLVMNANDRLVPAWFMEDLFPPAPPPSPLPPQPAEPEPAQEQSAPAT